MINFGSVQGISIPKQMFSDKKGRFITFQERFQLGLGDFTNEGSRQQHMGQELGLKIIENTPQEIYDAAMEMHHRLSTGFEWRDDDILRQKRFVEILRLYSAESPYYTNLGTFDSWGKSARYKISTQFLRDNEDLLN